MTFAESTPRGEEKLCTTNEAAEFFHVTPQTIRRWVKKGVFPNAKKVNFLERRIPISDLQEVKAKFEQTGF
ncbi:MAG: helix-turn-helix domain-containing protein [Anaerolineae bacterium]